MRIQTGLPFRNEPLDHSPPGCGVLQIPDIYIPTIVRVNDEMPDFCFLGGKEHSVFHSLDLFHVLLQGGRHGVTLVARRSFTRDSQRLWLSWMEYLLRAPPEILSHGWLYLWRWTMEGSWLPPDQRNGCCDLTRRKLDNSPASAGDFLGGVQYIDSDRVAVTGRADL